MGKTKQKQKFSRKNRKSNKIFISDEGYDIWEPFYWEK